MANDFDERWYYCLSCRRIWQAATWQLLNWACPSSLDESWPEFHPHIGWSYIRNRAGGVTPAEGRHLVLAPVRNGHELRPAG